MERFARKKIRIFMKIEPAERKQKGTIHPIFPENNFNQGFGRMETGEVGFPGFRGVGNPGSVPCSS